MKNTLQIGGIKFENPFILAPLAGYTDKSMRALCEEQGASLVFTEMVSGKGLLRKWSAAKASNTETAKAAGSWS